MEVSRVSLDGRIVWRASGEDIFTGGFQIREGVIQVVDFHDRMYEFDCETGDEV
jgi:hypothetical protein